MTAILLPAVIDQPAALPTLRAADIERAANFARQDKAPATRAAYKSDFSAFQAYCNSCGVASLPALPETVAGFLASEAERRLGRIDHRQALRRDPVRPQARRP
jgi:hypothetical protein